MKTLDDVVELGRKEQFLAVVSTLREAGTIQSSLVNAGVMTHPFTGEQVLAFVTYGPAKAAEPTCAAEPDGDLPIRLGLGCGRGHGRIDRAGRPATRGVDAERLRLMLREVFVSAGGTHDDWDGYDRTMAEQRRVVVLVRPTRIY